MKLSEQVDFFKAFVIYKLPNTSIIRIIYQSDNKVYEDPTLQQSGFYFYPYDVSRNKAIVFPLDKLTIKEYLLNNFAYESKTLSYEIVDKDLLEKNHTAKVEQAIEDIKNDKNLQKLVISSKFEIIASKFNWENSLLNLMHHYDNALVWLWHHPSVGTWMGATPELLGAYENDNFQTVSLAGTLPVKQDEPLMWSSKEIKEQALVTEYIENKLKKFTDDYTIGSPQTILQGNIAHIQSRFSVKISSDELNHLILQLHPTPAVCGLPTDRAKKSISRIENYDRKYYTGFLGWKTHEKLYLFVNLRSMMIQSFDKISIYVGGGILENSCPKKEWHEISNKSQVLISCLSE